MPSTPIAAATSGQFSVQMARNSALAAEGNRQNIRQRARTNGRQSRARLAARMRHSATVSARADPGLRPGAAQSRGNGPEGDFRLHQAVTYSSWKGHCACS